MQHIFECLLSKSTNLHHINRYIQFIKTRTGQGRVKHHILPKAKDMFPQFKSFTEHPWNLVRLTEREHFIAHRILSKIFPKSSQSRCFYYMMNSHCTDSKTYQMLLEEQKEYLLGNTFKLGKKESIETRAKKSAAQKGRLLGKQIGLGNKSRLGQKQSDEEKLKRSKALIGNQNAKGSQSHKANVGRKFYYNPSTGERRMFSDGPIPENFIKGMGPRVT